MSLDMGEWEVTGGGDVAYNELGQITWNQNLVFPRTSK